MMKMPIPIDGSVDDVRTILGVEEDYFSPDFEEYIRKERLYWSRIEGDPDDFGRPSIGWVFWSQLDNSADLIRQAIQKLIGAFKKELYCCLVQFWAATKTSEGRTLLTTQFQPFALGPTYTTDARKGLCDYRMGMCREYFYADAECAQEQLGLPGRVFLNQLPESTPNVEHYTLKEYPQRDLALCCKIISSMALPVFEHSSHTCVGVLEIVSLDGNDIEYWHDKKFLGHVYDIFQEFGLRCFEEYEHCKMQYWEKNEAPTAAFQELKMVYEFVCKIHNLPLALSWVSCHSGNDLLQSQFQFSVLDCSTDEEDDNDWPYGLLAFKNVSEVCLLKKGQVTGRILPLPNLLYCSDVKQFSIAEFPLVPYARCGKLGGWFTMCLQSSYTGDELYVLEFFLPEDYENILTKLRLILGTMEEYFKTFKLASGQGLGEELSVEVIDFQNGQKSRSIQMIPATRCIPGLEPLQDGGVMLQQDQQDQPSMDIINSGMHVVSEAQNYNLPIFDSLQNGKVTTQVDSSDQPSMDIFQVGRVKLQQAQQDQPSMDAINNGMYVVSEAQNDNLPSLDSLQNGKVMTQVDSSNQPSMDASSNGQNVITAERNIFVGSSSKEHERKTQDRKHKKGGPRIDIPKEEIVKCFGMYREKAAGKFGVGISTFKRVCRGHGIDQWPSPNIEKIQPSLPLPGFQDADMVTIRAKSETDTIKFRLSLSSTLEELHQQVANRLKLKAGTYRIKYKDEKDELILIAIDVDLQDCIQCFRSQGKNDIYITLEKNL